MTNLESLKSLQARIRLATGADRELDRDIATALGQMRPGGPLWPSLRFTLSLDACVGLLREVLPGVKWEKSYGGSFVLWRGGTRRLPAYALANDCLTFLDAIFSAKISELEARETVG